MSLTKNARVFMDMRSSKADMKSDMPRREGTTTLVWTMRASPETHAVRKCSRPMRSMSPNMISLLASRMSKLPSCVRCFWKEGLCPLLKLLGADLFGSHPLGNDE